MQISLFCPTFKQESLFRQIFLKHWWVIQKFAKKIAKMVGFPPQLIIKVGIISQQVSVIRRGYFFAIHGQSRLPTRAYFTLNHSRGIELEWFRSYLNGRQQCCKVNGHISKIESIRYGVPKGSCLGPLLFLMYRVSQKNCAPFA